MIYYQHSEAMQLMKYRIILFSFLFLLISTADAQCVYQSRTVTKQDAKIENRSEIRRSIVPALNGNKKCMVSFSVQINREWHMANGGWEWSGDAPHQNACAMAVKVAESEVLDRISDRNVSSEQVLICNDDERFQELKNISVGTVASIEQYRPHPEYTEEFYHNGAKCQWFVDTAFAGNDIRQYEGVICEIRSGEWVVVDKF